ncbi:sulfotransferase [Kiritimatiella glycovorans]|uniref:Sulfotransferase domain protein n=1 Tax=Kiritimatiella glycovorans TaxID=1307763 RepID=A0A0G3EJZ2_9BACT|nr:sulfotransferase [Kiritimatiella glycovorans]AKJ64449.1 hypothetical protein L21SP4_01201 [Kiritimatiella glycovorans]
MSGGEEVILHVGYPKSASTYLQQCIFPQLGDQSNLAPESRETKMLPFLADMDPEVLRERAGACRVPGPEPGRRHIVSCEDWVELWFRGIEDLLLRAAELNGLDPTPYEPRNARIVENLARTWPGAKVLIVVREPLAWAISKYRMHYRHHQTSAPIEELLVPELEGYDGTVARFREAFGADRVRVVPFEWILEDPQRFAEAAAKLIAPGATVRAPHTPSNQGALYRREVAVMRDKAHLKQTLRPTGARATLAEKARYEAARFWVKTVHRARYALQYGNRRDRVVVPESSRKELRPVLEACSRRLSEMTDIDFAALGYGG